MQNLNLDGLQKKTTGFYVVVPLFNRALSWHRTEKRAQAEVVYIRRFAGGGAKVVPASLLAAAEPMRDALQALLTSTGWHELSPAIGQARAALNMAEARA